MRGFSQTARARSPRCSYLPRAWQPDPRANSSRAFHAPPANPGHAQARHCATVALHQRGVRQLVKHHLRQHAFPRAPSPGPAWRRAAAWRPRGTGHPLPGETPAAHGHGIQQRLHAPMCKGAHQGVSLRDREDLSQFGRNHDRSGTSAKLEERGIPQRRSVVRRQPQYVKR